MMGFLRRAWIMKELAPGARYLCVTFLSCEL
jgi:hypothetical protein